MISLTADKKLFLNLFKAVSTAIEDATLDAQPEGLRVKAMSPDHIMMVDIFYPASSFIEYKVDSAVRFGVVTEDWIKAIKRFTGSITLTVGDLATLKSDSKSFVLHTIEALDTSQPLPKIPFACKLTIAKSDLKEALDDIAVVSEGLTIEAGETVTMSGHGDRGKAQAIPTVQKELTEPCKATYALPHIQRMVDAVDCETVTLEFATKRPLKMTLENIRLYLAPRVQD